MMKQHGNKNTAQLSNIEIVSGLRQQLLMVTTLVGRFFASERAKIILRS